MCSAIICCAVRDVICFEINLCFLIKFFFYITRKSGRKYRGPTLIISSYFNNSLQCIVIWMWIIFSLECNCTFLTKDISTMKKVLWDIRYTTSLYLHLKKPNKDSEDDTYRNFVEKKINKKTLNLFPSNVFASTRTLTSPSSTPLLE